MGSASDSFGTRFAVSFVNTEHATWALSGFGMIGDYADIYDLTVDTDIQIQLGDTFSTIANHEY